MKIEGYSINMEWKHMRPLLTRNFYAVSAASVFGDLYGTKCEQRSVPGD
jgi:hypothetical protein